MTQAQQATTVAPRRPNHRRSRRQPSKGGTRVRVFGNAMRIGTNIGVQVLDVSETGARLILTRDLPRDQLFEIEFQSVGSRFVRMQAFPVWSVATADGKFVVGATFQKPLSYLDLQTLAKV